MAAIVTRAGRPACSGGRPASQPGEQALPGTLSAALHDTWTAAAQLAARFRAYAADSQLPGAFGRAAAMSAAAQALGQAWLLASRDGIAAAACPESTARGPADLPGRTDRPQEIAQLLAGTRLLSEALSTLAARTGPAASPPPGCLAGIHACLQAAQRRLGEARGEATPPGSVPPAATSPPGSPGPW
jgi:hypothetical protein